MRILTNAISLLTCLLVLTGCPYQSAVPVGDPDQKLIKNLLGKWQKDDENENHFLVEKLGKYQYQIEENIFNSELQAFEKAYYSAHITEVNGEKFLSIINQTLNETGEQNYFSIYKLVLVSDSKLIMYPLSNYIREKFDDSSTLRKFIEDHMELSFFFGEEETFRKVINP